MYVLRPAVCNDCRAHCFGPFKDIKDNQDIQDTETCGINGFETYTKEL